MAVKTETPTHNAVSRVEMCSWKGVTRRTCRATVDVRSADDGDGCAARICFAEAGLVNEFANGGKPHPGVKIKEIEGGSDDDELEHADDEDESSAGKCPRIKDERVRVGDGDVAQCVISRPAGGT